MRTVLCTALLIAGTVATESYEAFLERFRGSNWAHLYTKEAFLENLRDIQMHDDKHFTRGVNQFTGIPKQKVLSYLGEVGGSFTCPTDADAFHSDTPVYQSEFDWRVQGSKVQIKLNVHDQGLQGGGIVHAAVGALEEHY